MDMNSPYTKAGHLVALTEQRQCAVSTGRLLKLESRGRTESKKEAETGQTSPVISLHKAQNAQVIPLLIK